MRGWHARAEGLSDDKRFSTSVGRVAAPLARGSLLFPRRPDHREIAMKTGGTIKTNPSRSQSSDQGRNRAPRRRAGLMAKMNGRLALSAVAAMAALSLTRPAHGQVTGTWIN